MTSIVDNKIQIRDEEIATLKEQITALLSRTEMLERTVAKYGSVEFKAEERARIERLELTQAANLLSQQRPARMPSPWRSPATLNTASA